MAKYRVKVAQILLSRRKPYNNGDVLDESAFGVGGNERAEKIAKLLKGKYIEVVDAPQEEQQAPPPPPADQEQPEDQVSEQGSQPQEAVGDVHEESGEDVTYKELKDKLKEMGVKFPKNASKKELYDLFMEHQRTSE